MHLDATHNVVLFKEKSFVCLSEDHNQVYLRRVSSEDHFNPEFGDLLYDVDVTVNKEVNSFSIQGELFTVFRPEKNLLMNNFSLVKTSKLKHLKDFKDEDIILKLGKCSIIKRKYYYYKEPKQINRCFFNTPITILNCFID